jgi:pre-mRNA-splicing factor ATP-dependent RNA helicase DHX15/PRP43
MALSNMELTNFYNSYLNPLTGHPFTQKYWNLLQTRTKLPVWSKKAEFMRLLDQCQCILIEAETGSGKTTQIPQWCAEWLKTKEHPGAVCCTQPRRLAAVSVARRVAEEMDVKVTKMIMEYFY